VLLLLLKARFTTCEKVEEITKTLGTKEKSLVSNREGGKNVGDTANLFVMK
jgi:hypothetical protein